MAQIRFVIPSDRLTEFVDNLTAWAAAANKKDLQLLPAGNPFETTNKHSPVKYAVAVDETFFDTFPSWRQHIEQ